MVGLGGGLGRGLGGLARFAWNAKFQERINGNNKHPGQLWEVGRVAV